MYRNAAPGTIAGPQIERQLPESSGRTGAGSCFVDPIADLYEDIAAEEKAQATYQWLIEMTDDVDQQDSLKFLREREIIHAIRFKESVQILMEEQGEKRVF